MSTTPSSSSKERSKKAKKKEEKDPEDLEREKEEDKKLADAFCATSLGQRFGVTDEQLARVSSSDDPPCDGCSKPFSGTMQCSRCESVFYCGRECQVSHWASCHKDECSELKKKNEDTAKRVIENFQEVHAWVELDVTGVYKAAVKHGFHDKIREVLELDKSDIFHLYREGRGGAICYSHWVMMVLFRGHRGEGRDGVERAYNCVDGGRIKGYVRSHPDALDAWLQASVQLVRAVADRTIMRRNPDLYSRLLRATRSVWSGWSSVFQRSSASRAILSPFPCRDATGEAGKGESKEQRRRRGVAHARRVVEAFAEGNRIAASVRKRPSITRDESALEHTLCLVAAMVHLRTKEYGIGIDVEGMLNLRGTNLELFRHFYLPMAERSIKTGGQLSAQDLNAVMAQTSQAMDLHHVLGYT